MMKQRELTAQKYGITVLKTYVGKTKLEISKISLCKLLIILVAWVKLGRGWRG